MCKKVAIFYLLFFGLLAHAIAQQKTPVIVPFTLTREGHIFVKANINGVEGNFIFDTGAGLNMLTKKFADKITSLKKTEGFYVGHRATGEAIESDLWIINNLSMGSFTAANQKATVIDVDFPLDGLISLTPFKTIPITIDYTNKQLIIETAASLKKRVSTSRAIPIQISDDREITLEISTYVKLNNLVTAQISLDCGAGFNVFRFNSRYMKPLGIDTAAAVKKYLKSPFDSTKINTSYTTGIAAIHTVNEVSATQNIKATFIDGLIYEGITSINWLGDKITIDMAKKRLLVKKVP